MSKVKQLNHQNNADFVVLVSEQVNVGKHMFYSLSYIQKRSPRCVFQERSSRYIWAVYRRTSMQKCDFSFIEMTLLHVYSSINVLHICSRAPFLQNTYGKLLLYIVLNIKVRKSKYGSRFWVLKMVLQPI